MQPDYRRLAEGSADAVFRWLFDSGLSHVNPGFVRMTGYAVDSPTDPGLLRNLIEPPARPEFDGVIERLRQGAVTMETMVAQLIRRDGGQVWVEFSLIPVHDGRGEVIGVDGVGRDVSQHLAVADQLSRRTLEQAVLLQVQRELLAQLDLMPTLNKIVERAQRLLHASTCTVFLLEADGISLRPLASAGDFAEELMTQRPRLGESFTGWVVEHAVPQKVDRTSQDARPAQVPATPVEDESLLCAPLEIAGQVAGALLVSGQPDQYTENDLDFLVALAQVASLAIANSQTFDQVQRQATLDNLTGAFNRHFLTQNLRAELARADRLGYSVGLLMVDVDNLKRVNDDHGHLVGDDLLKAVVEGLRAAGRETDWVARYGGDEFAVVLPGCPPDQLPTVGEKLRRSVAERRLRLPDGGSLGITVSLGGSVFPEIARNLDELLAQADANELRAKQANGDQVIIEALARREPANR
jgi:diguanylate cyclase (GGDEF)-like protein/PAS domain S-box-containing protein